MVLVSSRTNKPRLLSKLKSQSTYNIVMMITCCQVTVLEFQDLRFSKVICCQHYKFVLICESTDQYGSEISTFSSVALQILLTCFGFNTHLTKELDVVLYAERERC